MSIVRRLRLFLHRLLRGQPPVTFRRLARVPELPDVPGELAADTIYIVGSAAMAKWAVLRCPCERGHPVTLNLQVGSFPWKVTERRGKPSVYPSIDVRGDRSGGTRCHYWVRQGVVHWVPEWWIETENARS